MNTNAMTTAIKSAELNLYFTKEVDRLDFTIHACDAKGRKCTVDGFVARVWGTNRYYVNSEVLPIDFRVTDTDVFGKKSIGYCQWQQTDGHFTLKGAIKHHLETVWGITVVDEIVMPTKLQTYIVNEAKKKILAIVSGFDAVPSIDKKEFAKTIIQNGTCFVDKCNPLDHTIMIGVYNLSPTAVADQWNELVGNY